MRKTILLILIAINSIAGFSQESRLKGLLEEGMKLYDLGDYEGSIEKYQRALLYNQYSPAVHYELAMSYYSLRKYGEALDHCEIAMNQKSDVVLSATILYGTILDEMGKPKQSIRFYQKALRKYPGSYLLSYNYALSCYRNHLYTDAESAAINAVRLNPMYAGTHLLLGYIMSSMGERIKSALSLYYFLLLEPKTERSSQALELLKQQLNGSSIPDSIYQNNTNHEYQIVLKLLDSLHKESDKSTNDESLDYKVFAENNEKIFKTLSNLVKENDNTDPPMYRTFFKDLYESGNTEAYSYFIAQSSDDLEVIEWIKNNSLKLEHFADWLEKYQ
jgi:tetratricopeptide (TPR) repeat protein